MDFRSFLRLAVRNASRKRSRTLLTAGSVVAGTALLIAPRAFLEGVIGGAINDAVNAGGHVRVVDPEFAAREQLMPLDRNLPDVEPMLAAIRAAPGVREVWPRIASGVLVSAGEEMGEHFGLAVGAPSEFFTERVNADASLVEGRWFDEGKEELVVGISVARETGAKVGQELLLVGTTQDGSISPIQGTVAGIVQSHSALLDQAVFVPLPRMQWMLDLDGGALEILVFGRDREHSRQLADTLRGLPALAGTTVQPWVDREPWSGMMKILGTVRGILVSILVLMASLGVWNTMMMSVLERTAEIGVLRAMGMTRLQTMAMFVGEAITIAVLGGLLGAFLGSMGGLAIEHWGIEIGEKITSSMGADTPIKSHVYGDLRLRHVVQSFGLGMLMAFLGSFTPALRAAFVQPVTAMRTGR